MTARTYEVSDEDFPNPERGLMQFVELSDRGDIAYVAGLGVSLGNARIRLDRFRDRALPAAFLDQLLAGLDAIRGAGLKLVLRFQYNADAGGRDAPLEQVLEHIAQLGPILHRNADVIAVVQAGFIGAWGEWHSSTQGLDDAAGRAAVLRAVLEAVPPSRMVQVRTPFFKDEVYPGGPVEPDTAFTGEGLARVGHHNDCFLASDHDDGTYREPIQRWKDYVIADGRFVVVGGETCRPNPPRTDCASAEAELRAKGWSYLNGFYHPEVIEAWKRGGCYDRIRRNLGYRLALRWARWSEAPVAGGQVEVALRLDNLGYAAMYNPRPVYLVVDGNDRRVEALLPQADPRRWSPGQPHELHGTVDLPADLPPGSYRLSLWLPDAAQALASRPAYAVRLASTGVWDPDTGLNVLTDQLVVAGP